MKDIVQILYENYRALYECYNNWVYRYYSERYDIQESSLQTGSNINIQGEGKVIIGEGTYIGNFSHLVSEKNMIISIGKNCAISHRVSIYTVNRKSVKYNENKSVREQDYEYGNVYIGNNCVIGINVVILQGVTIGNNCFIGANAVVTKDIPDYSVAVGVPARVIKTIEH